MSVVIDDAFRAVGRGRIGDSRNVTRVERDHEANADVRIDGVSGVCGNFHQVG